jgi:C1A family cysteine protease
MSFLSLIKSFFEKLFHSSEVQELEAQLAGWIPQHTDTRDRVYGLSGSQAGAVDLRSMFGPIESQGNLNSCVGHATTSVLEAVAKVSDRSRLFTYYNARSLEGRAASDAGCQIRNAMRSIAMYGSADETMWPYDASKVFTKPGTDVYSNGLPAKSLIASYASITTFASLKNALTNAHPVVFGFSVPASFRTVAATTGIQPYPATGEAIIGGHAVVAVGFDDLKVDPTSNVAGMILCRNSFGPNWGQSGYFWMPYAWFNNMNGLVSDAWTIIPR